MNSNNKVKRIVIGYPISLNWTCYYYAQYT